MVEYTYDETKKKEDGGYGRMHYDETKKKEGGGGKTYSLLMS